MTDDAKGEKCGGHPCFYCDGFGFRIGATSRDWMRCFVCGGKGVIVLTNISMA